MKISEMNQETDKDIVATLERIDRILDRVEHDLTMDLGSSAPYRNIRLIQTIRVQVLGLMAYVDCDAHSP